MLENYYEEIARKRHERGMFWFIVWALSIFLYLFFQGYYPYVKFDMGKFFETAEQRPSDLPENKPQVVRAFGIINVRTVPAPDRILISSSTIGEKSIPNDDKGFFDFGSYAVKIEKEGYVPVTLSTVLDKENSFSISVLELFKRPVYAPFIIPANLTEDLGGGKLLVRERTSTGEALTGGTLSGSVYRLVDSKDFSVTSSFRTDAKYLGGTLFEKHGAILSYDEDLGLVPAKMKTSSGETVLTLCEDALLEAGKVVCPKNGNVLFPHETTLKDRLLGASGRAIRMEKETVRVEGGRQISSEPVVTATGSKPGNVVRLAKTQYRLSWGELHGMTDTAPSFVAKPLSSVAAVHDFGNESVILGYSGEDAAFVLVDERANRYPAIIGNVRLSDVRIESYHGAYLVSDGKALYLYYKGSKELTKLIDGKVLGFFADSVIFEKEGATYKLDMVVGE